MDLSLNEKKMSWSRNITSIFSVPPPARTSWTDLDEIVASLSAAFFGGFSHTYFPTRGFKSFWTVERSQDPGCIEFSREGGSDVCQPRILDFCYFEKHPPDSFFLLDCYPLQPVGSKTSLTGIEEVVRLTGGKFMDCGEHDALCEDVANSVSSAPPLLRHLEGGKFFVVARKSLGDRISQFNSGLHNRIPLGQMVDLIEMAQVEEFWGV